jgi:LmbE family N-acetylglucosaminyl deacetylase
MISATLTDPVPSRSNRPGLSGRSVLFLHAHPDDEAIFTAVTMRRLADQGVRVILVMATGGELGEQLAPLRPGETVHRRRIVELEAAAERLGVARLVLLGRRDSGMAGWPSGRHPRALARGRTDQLARRLAGLVERERAEAVVHYDDRGIYGHPDHVAVHRIGALAAALTGATGYEATVDRDHLRSRSDPHLVHAASGHTGDYGRPGAEIPLRLRATESELAAKRDAMAAHASQIMPTALAGAGFADTYGHEWYLRAGPPGVLDHARPLR